MMISEEHTISSLSKDWIESVKSSGRFSHYSWDRKAAVPVTTLDKIILELGMPSFIKIDVEGFEYAVLKGLSYKIPALSYEFTPEYVDSALKCIHYLSSMGIRHFNYSIEESMKLALNQWVAPEDIRKVLTSLQNKSIFGDIYAKTAL